jgi:hypothetical protein
LLSFFGERTFESWAGGRSFHADRFELPTDGGRPVRPLLLDDTWTTGSRLQSLTFALKQAGAAKVVAVVLGRHVNPDFEQSKAFVARLRDMRFEPTHGALED